METIKKIVILDQASDITYVSDYDTACFDEIDGIFDFIEEFNNANNLNISANNISYMIVNEFVLKSM